MKTMLELETGDEIIVYMRLGLSLRLGRRPDGVGYRFVPPKPQKAASWDLTRFAGTIIENDTTTRIVKMNTVGINSWRTPISTSPKLPAEIHYSAMGRVYLLSAFNFEPREENRSGGLEARPTTAALGTNFKPFRTVENILIPQ